MLELLRGLVKHRIMPEDALREIDGHYQAWLNRQGGYLNFKDAFVETYMKRAPGLCEDDVRRVSHLVVEEQKNRVYVYARALIQELKATHTLVAISGSPAEIVEEFQKHLGFDYAFGSVYEVKDSRYTGTVWGMANENKIKKLNELLVQNGFSLHESVGVGDTESDIYFLSEVDNPIAFNPNRELYDHARQHGWKIVVERKDVIYEL